MNTVRLLFRSNILLKAGKPQTQFRNWHFFGLSNAYCTSRLPAPQSDVSYNDKLHPSFDVADHSELESLARNLAPVYNFAAYVNQSKSLQQLIDLGVELYRYENKPEVAEFILRLDFDNDIKPYIQFLCDNGVLPENLGKIFSKNILICSTSMDDLQVRVNYLESKKFSKHQIGSIITRNPMWLTTPIPLIDKRLGWMQKNYKLSGDEVRGIINTLPTIVTFNIQTIKLNNFVFEEEMEMSKQMIRKMLILRPRLFIRNQKKLLEAFEFVHKVMRIPLDRIHQQPDVLMTRISQLRERHQFLQSLGRAQYNPALPGYVSLNDVALSNDTIFVTDVAKSSMPSFNLFLKTL